jgi:hypothetical protein
MFVLLDFCVYNFLNHLFLLLLFLFGVLTLKYLLTTLLFLFILFLIKFN